MADDGGMHAETDRAIRQTIQQGIVGAVSVVAGGESAEDLLDWCRSHGIAAGLHVNLTEGVSRSGPIDGLTDSAGRFIGDKARVWDVAARAGIDQAQLWRELDSQFEWFESHNVRPRFINGHNHVHLFPQVREWAGASSKGAWFRISCEGDDVPVGLPGHFVNWCARIDGVTSPQKFAGHRFARNPSVEAFLQSLWPGCETQEFMVHPGARPGSEFCNSDDRLREVEVLCDATLAEALRLRGVHVLKSDEFL